ncbi:hypothetical protein M422DRAFT_774176 [Sphaerobolus stellatus SS14]|nr:hypothetical protein M422DRAFT_774176 [Sphaerobolus stellatus SS14]
MLDGECTPLHSKRPSFHEVLGGSGPILAALEDISGGRGIRSTIDHEESLMTDKLPEQHLTPRSPTTFHRPSANGVASTNERLTDYPDSSDFSELSVGNAVSGLIDTGGITHDITTWSDELRLRRFSHVVNADDFAPTIEDAEARTRSTELVEEQFLRFIQSCVQYRHEIMLVVLRIGIISGVTMSSTNIFPSNTHLK